MDLVRIHLLPTAGHTDVLHERPVAARPDRAGRLETVLGQRPASHLARCHDAPLLVLAITEGAWVPACLRVAKVV